MNDDLVAQLRYMADVEGRAIAGEAATEIRVLAAEVAHRDRIIARRDDYIAQLRAQVSALEALTVASFLLQKASDDRHEMP